MENKEDILVVIAARGGSKGVKNKNIRLLAGKPLIAYAVQQAVNWNKAKDIVCSTDSGKIADIARRYGAKVPFLRPKSLSGDKAAKMDVIRHALLSCEKIYGKIYDIIVDLDVTAPVRRNSDLDKCLRLFRRYRPKTLFSVVESRRNPYFNMVEIDKDGKAALSKKPTRHVYRRQDAPVTYDMNASIYFYGRDYLLDRTKSSVISDNSIIYVMDELSGTDIDREVDFKYIEFLIKEGVWKIENLKADK